MGIRDFVKNQNPNLTIQSAKICHTAYVVYYANIKFDKLKCNVNWQTFSLAYRMVLSIDCMSNTSDINYMLTYTEFGNQSQNRQK